MGAPAEGLPYLQRAVTIYEKKLGPDHSSLVELLDGVASAYLALHSPERAQPLLERALKISQAGGVPPESAAVAQGHLAQALWAGGSRDRAKRLALEARDKLRSAPGSAEELAKLERWLAAH
jgi:hypothetical protein